MNPLPSPYRTLSPPPTTRPSLRAFLRLHALRVAMIPFHLGLAFALGPHARVFVRTVFLLEALVCLGVLVWLWRCTCHAPVTPSPSPSVPASSPLVAPDPAPMPATLRSWWVFALGGALLGGTLGVLYGRRRERMRRRSARREHC